MRKQTFLVLFVVGNIFSTTAFGWGALGHRIVAHVGSTLASGFWAENSQAMLELSTVPDYLYKKAKTRNQERPTHYFQPDAYFENPSEFSLIPTVYVEVAQKFGVPFVTKNGTAPWRARQFYDVTVQALRDGDFEAALQYAGVMSHYIGDMSQPLHDTINYDGQLTHQQKIHSFFESKNIKESNLPAITNAVKQVAAHLLSDAKFRNEFKGTVNNVLFNEVNRAYSYKDTLLAIDRQQGRTGVGAQNLLKLAITRMGDGAATLTLILAHAWADAGNPEGGGTLNVRPPAWLAPNFGDETGEVFESSLPGDDCDDESPQA